MPTVVSVDGFDLVIYTGFEHRPLHVHVFKAGQHLRVALGDSQTYPFVIGKGNTMSGKDLVRAVRLVAEYQGSLIETWRRIHGPDCPYR